MVTVISVNRSRSNESMEYQSRTRPRGICHSPNINVDAIQNIYKNHYIYTFRCGNSSLIAQLKTYKVYSPNRVLYCNGRCVKNLIQ